MVPENSLYVGANVREFLQNISKVRKHVKNVLLHFFLTQMGNEMLKIEMLQFCQQSRKHSCFSSERIGLAGQRYLPCMPVSQEIRSPYNALPGEAVSYEGIFTS